jgi:hypothetical protein
MTAVWILIAVAALIAATLVALAIATRMLGRSRLLAEAAVSHLEDETTVDEQGAARSVQSAEVELPCSELDRIWSPMHLEQLARTYWRFLSRITLGLIRVDYTDRERFVVLLARPFKLLTFKAPEYEITADRGVVRWRIERGLLVARGGRGGCGYLQIDVRRIPSDDPERARVHVAVEVANFYPAIAHRLSRWVYTQTQSRAHVVVTYAFLRSLARLDLAESKVGRLAPLAAAPTGSDDLRATAPSDSARTATESNGAKGPAQAASRSARR